MIMTILFRPQKGPQLELHAERVLVLFDVTNRDELCDMFV